MESYIVACPPLTYVLQFSWFAVLTSCPEDMPQALHVKASSRDAATELLRLIGKLHITRSPYDFKVSELYYHHNTQIDTGETCTGGRSSPEEEKGADTEAGMLSGISPRRSVRQRPYCFTECCNSQCLSHFAASFIVI